jgi:heavy metal sensor kinase
VTLTTRLSLFFSLLLAVVLAGFSTTLYLLAAAHFQRQADERLTAALSTLVAAAEVTSEGIVWDLSERRLDLPAAGFGGPVAWQVHDECGNVIDYSRQPDANSLPITSPKEELVAWNNAQWLMRQARVEYASAGATGTALLQPAQPDDDPKYPAVLIAAAVSLAPAAALLRELALALGGLSLTIWLIAWIAGRVVCRRALLPVRRMAAAAREIRGDELQRRLPPVATSDELQELCAAFNSLLDRLHSAFERERQFTADASHQLRTPLAAILGQVEVALRRERSAEEYRRVLSTVHDKAGHLTGIMESLLFLARADANKQCLERTTIDLTQWLQLLLQSWSHHERFSDITAVVDGHGPCSVEVHPALLDELLNILLDNACKFSQPGSPIAVRLQRRGSVAYLNVEDNGCGIDDADLPHLFMPFVRGAEARDRKIEGVGLGLSIAKRLAAALGGRLEVTSRIGKGSCFTLIVPIATLADEAQAHGVELSV